MTLQPRHTLPAIAFAVASLLPSGTASAATPLGELSLRQDRSGTEITLPGTGTLQTTQNRVSDLRLIDVAGSTTRVALWTETDAAGKSVSWYAISLDGTSWDAVKPTSYELLMRPYAFDPLTQPSPFAGTGLEASGDLYLVQFETQPLQAYRDAIVAAGGEISTFIGNHAYVVHLPGNAKAAVEAEAFVRWVGPYSVGFRLDTGLIEDLQAGKVPATQRYQIMLRQQSEALKRELAGKITALGGEVGMLDEGSSFMQVFLGPNQVAEVASLDEVLALDVLGDYEPDMDIVRQFGGADYLETQANWQGEGVRAETADTGVDGNGSHTEFNSFGGQIGNHGGGSGGGHGTNVHGVVFMRGVSEKGMLPRAEQQWWALTSGWTSSSGSPGPGTGGSNTGRYLHHGQLADPAGIYRGVFQTNSTGSPRTAMYTTVSAQMDEIVFDHNQTVTQSQSNAGTTQSRPQAWGKNMLGIGGVKHQNTLTRADDNWTFGGSIGPATDGRIKPDLAYFYDNVRTTSGTSGYTSSFGGTSCATPITAGHFGLFYQMWHEGAFHLGQKQGTTVFNGKPNAMTAKAFMIASATQWTFSGASHDLTRVHQGWGNADVQTLWDNRDNMFFVDETDVLTNLQKVGYSVKVLPGEPQLKVTLAYMDLYGNPAGQGQHRQNNLDLKVTSPTGTVYHGNNGLLANMWSTAGGVPNTVDTVENVFIQNPMAGDWNVEVTAAEIVVDTHVETPAMDADFALVVIGGGGTKCEPPAVYCTPKVNSLGCTPYFGVTGAPSAGATSGFVIQGFNFRNNKAGLLAYSVTGPNSAPFNGGTLCLASPVRRTPGQFAGGNPGPVQDCSGSYSLDFNAFSAGMAGGNPDPALQVPGTKVYTQWFARDQGFPAPNNWSLSDGLSFEQCP